MLSPKLPVLGLATVALLGGVALGSELQRPAADSPAHAMRATAASRLINDPRIAAVLTEAAQHALAPLRSSNNDLNPPPLTRAVPRAGSADTSPAVWSTPDPPLAFNNDKSGLPQNTESLTSCNGGQTIIGAYNDFRQSAVGGDFSGWSLSNNSGASLTNTNFIPGVTVSVVVSGPASGPSPKGGPPSPTSSPPQTGGGGQNVYVATQGDPTVRATQDCNVYASSLIVNEFNGPFVAGVVVDRSDAATLATCTDEKACWTKRRSVVLTTDPSVFIDKPTLSVDPNTPNAPVWIGFTKFAFDQNFNLLISVNVIRCDALLAHCSNPVALETDLEEFFGGPFVLPTWSSIASGSDGTTHVSWATISQPSGSNQASLRVNVASAAPGSLHFGSGVTVTQITLPVFNPFASETIQINGFPEIAVSHVGGVDRIHVVWGQCRDSVLDICEHSKVVLASSQTGAAGTWSIASIAPGAASDFFPTVTTDSVTGGLVVGFWSTRFDPQQHLFDVLAVPVDAASGTQSTPVRVSATSIEPDNDSLLDAFYIGDYWELTAVNGSGWAHYTSTQRLQRLLGQGVAIPQQDNVLDRFAY